VFLCIEHGVDFVADNIEPRTEDLLLFAFIAAQPNEREARKALRSRWAGWFFWLWGLANRKRRWPDEMAKLRDYLIGQTLAPKIQTQVGETRRLNAPEHWRLLCMLMVDFGMTEREARDTGLVYARALWGVEGERQGKFTLAWDANLSASIDRLKGRDGPS
jgi:hypothetical protein